MTKSDAIRCARNKSKGKICYVVYEGDDSYDWTDSEIELETFFLGCPIVEVFEDYIAIA